VLARRKTGGKITGEILINGRKADSQLNRIIGYVEQQDIHNPTQTVLEALEFSATVRNCT
jgi:ABC-type multidrug transport system ATPase subunit